MLRYKVNRPSTSTYVTRNNYNCCKFAYAQTGPFYIRRTSHLLNSVELRMSLARIRSCN